MKRSLKILIACLAFLPSLPSPAPAAGWSTNLWPSGSTWFAGKARKDELVAAVNERCLATGSGLIATGGWFCQRAKLVECKATIKALIPSFADTTKASAGLFDAWFQTNDLVPALDATTVCARAGAPTNWLDVTP
jgi:hypothetical protein